MYTKKIFGWSIIIIILVGIVFFVTIFVFPKQPPVSVYVNPIQNIIVPQQVLAQLPVQLVISKIHVNAFIEYLGLTSSGAMAVPTGPDDVAWFDLGPRPGNVGAAVIAGHEGWKAGMPAVFDNLHELKVGDKIDTVDGSGATTTFIVQKLGTYDQNANSATVFSANDGLAHLNLITCEGTWNAAEQSYSNRLVVFAEKQN
jgi:hypothetical protein